MKLGKDGMVFFGGIPHLVECSLVRFPNADPNADRVCDCGSVPRSASNAGAGPGRFDLASGRAAALSGGTRESPRSAPAIGVLRDLGGSADERTCGQAVVKRCSCGQAYDRKTWSLLRRVGYQLGVPKSEDSPGVPHELRNCLCGSTISIEVTFEELVLVLTCAPDKSISSAAKAAIAMLTQEREAASRRARTAARRLIDAEARSAELARELVGRARKQTELGT
jgi:hypothetical protein